MVNLQCRERCRESWLDDALSRPDRHSRTAQGRRSDYLTGGIVGVATLVDIVTADHSPRSAWFVGPFGWVLKDARPVPFAPCPGKPGLFRVPDRLIVLEGK